MKTVARTVVAVLCFVLMAFWVIWGGTESGYNWFLNSVARQFSAIEPKSALALLVLALPVLLSGIVATICLKQETQGSDNLGLFSQLEDYLSCGRSATFDMVCFGLRVGECHYGRQSRQAFCHSQLRLLFFVLELIVSWPAVGVFRSRSDEENAGRRKHGHNESVVGKWNFLPQQIACPQC
jgi:hypothetical protein